MSAPTPSAYDAFYADKTPANAVALARADHRAHSGHNASEFLDALDDAEAQCLAHDGLVAALHNLRIAFRECVGSEAFADFEATNPAVVAANAALRGAA